MKCPKDVLGLFIVLVVINKKEECKGGIFFGTRLTDFVDHFDIITVRKDVDIMNNNFQTFF